MDSFPGNDVTAWLSMCVKHNDVRTARWVIAGARKHQLNSSHLDTALASPHNGDIAHLLMLAGVTAGSTSAFCPRTVAAVELLAAAGADFDVTNSEGQTPLHTAAATAITVHAMRAITKQMVMSLECLDTDGNTAAMVALAADRPCAVIALLAAGAQAPPLGLAGSPAMTRLLMQLAVCPTLADYGLLQERQRGLKFGWKYASDRKLAAVRQVASAHAKADAEANLVATAEALNVRPTDSRHVFTYTEDELDTLVGEYFGAQTPVYLTKYGNVANTVDYALGSPIFIN